MLLACEGEERKQVLEMARNKSMKPDRINMAYLLQKLDGLESSDNRCIVATTNYPEKLNSALIRPGRFDIKICLGHCTHNMYKEILSNFYHNDKSVSEKMDKFVFPEKKITPLQLINMAIQYKNVDELLENIK